ncbi:hypothetical protein AAG906_019258 [Vitis piasezkii]
MSLKQSVLSLLYFRIPRMSRPILTSFMRSWTTKPPPQRKMRDKREMLSISQKQIPPPHAPTVRLPRNRKGGPGARASWVGV